MIRGPQNVVTLYYFSFCNSIIYLFFFFKSVSNGINADIQYLDIDLLTSYCIYYLSGWWIAKCIFMWNEIICTISWNPFAFLILFFVYIGTYLCIYIFFNFNLKIYFSNHNHYNNNNCGDWRTHTVKFWRPLRQMLQ